MWLANSILETVNCFTPSLNYIGTYFGRAKFNDSKPSYIYLNSLGYCLT